MTSLPMLQLSACVIPNAVPHPSQWLGRVTGETLYRDHKKQQNYVADSTVHETVVPRMIRHALVILECRIRRLSVPLRQLTKPLSLDSYVTFHDSYPSFRSSLRIQRWPALENPPSTVTARISSAIPRVELKCFY